jgi:hypothetical protein
MLLHYSLLYSWNPYLSIKEGSLLVLFVCHDEISQPLVVHLVCSIGKCSMNITLWRWRPKVQEILNFE